MINKENVENKDVVNNEKHHFFPDFPEFQIFASSIEEANKKLQELLKNKKV